MTEKKLSKVFKKDVEKYLGIIPDKRRKDFKQFIAEDGGYTNAIETLKSRLNETTEFKFKKEVRQKQVKVHKKYETKQREITEYRYIGNIQVELLMTRMINNPNGSKEKLIDISAEFENIRFDKIANLKKLENDVAEEVNKLLRDLSIKNSLIIQPFV